MKTSSAMSGTDLGRVGRVAVALWACLLASCPATAPRRDNVVLIVLDTVRADKLGCYGGPRGLTPNLDRFAEQGVLFEHTSAHAPWTLPSTASLYTGLLPPRHGAGGFLPRLTKLSERTETLASLAQKNGYATHAIVNVAFLGAAFGLARGFESVDERFFENNEEVRRADETVALARDWLEGWFDIYEERPFLLVVHLFDAHAIYDPPQPFRRRFAAPEDAEGDRFAFGSREDMVRLRSGALALDADTMRRAEALYDGEIAFVDEQVGRLLDTLTELGLDDSTLVAITADHGEEFLDHGGFEHGHTHYAELLHVPLLMRHRSLPSGKRVSQASQHIDVLPTVCDLVGWKTPTALDGESLLRLVRDPDAAGRATLAIGNFWGPPLASLRTANDKLIVHPAGSARAPELYLWREDAREQHDVARNRTAEMSELQNRLRLALTRLEQLSNPREEVDVDLELQRVLETLGYTEAADPNRRER